MRNKVLIAFMCTTVMSLTINAQNKPADKAFQLQKYQKAIKLYKLALEKGVDSLYNAEKLAATYQTIGDLANAEVWYAKVADNKNAGINVVEQYAEVLRSNKKFTEASRYYDLAVKSGKATQRTKEALASMDKIRVLDRPQPAYSVELLPFNTSRSEQSPIISEQGKILLASNKLKGANKPDKRKGYTLYEAFVDSNAALTKYSGTKQQNKFNYSS